MVLCYGNPRKLIQCPKLIAHKLLGHVSTMPQPRRQKLPKTTTRLVLNFQVHPIHLA